MEISKTTIVKNVQKSIKIYSSIYIYIYCIYRIFALYILDMLYTVYLGHIDLSNLFYRFVYFTTSFPSAAALHFLHLLLLHLLLLPTIFCGLSKISLNWVRLAIYKLLYSICIYSGFSFCFFMFFFCVFNFFSLQLIFFLLPRMHPLHAELP